MAGDWIKMRNDLPNDPAVYKIAALTRLDRFAVIGRLYAFWSWADKHAVDGRVDGATSTVVDDVVRHDGFAESLAAVRWLEISEDSITLPHHERHNGESGKERGLKNARQARWRQSKTTQASTDVDVQASTSPSTEPSTREEKRREEKKEQKNSSPTRVGGTRFEEFWAVYPRHVARKVVEQRWKNRKLDRVADSIIANVRLRLSGDWCGKDMQFIPLPLTYVNQDRWDDETDAHGKPANSAGVPEYHQLRGI